MSSTNEDHPDSRRKHGAAGIQHDSLPTPDLRLNDNTPTLVGQLLGNPFDALFRRAIVSTNDPEHLHGHGHTLLSAPSISVSTPNTADLFAMLGGSITSIETEAKQPAIAAANRDANKRDSDVPLTQKPNTNASPSKEESVRRGPKKFHLSRQNSAAQSDDDRLGEAVIYMPNANQNANSNANANLKVSVTPNETHIDLSNARPRPIAKKRTSLSIKLPSNNATSPCNDVPSVSSSTEEGATQTQPVAGTNNLNAQPTQQAALCNNQRMGASSGAGLHEGMMGEAFLAQFDKRDGVQTPTTAEIINAAIDMQNDGKPHHSHLLSLGHSNHMPVSSLTLANNQSGNAHSHQQNISPPQRGAHANVNVNASALGLQSASNANNSKLPPTRQSVAMPIHPSAPSLQQNAGNSALLAPGGQVIFLPANLLGGASQQQGAPLYIIAPPNSLGQTQLIPTAGNTLMLPGPGPQQPQQANVSFGHASDGQLNNGAAAAASNKPPNAKEALKRAIYQSKPGADAANANDAKVPRLGAGPSAFEQVAGVPQRHGATNAADIKPNYTLLQHAAVDSTTRFNNAAHGQHPHQQMAVAVAPAANHAPFPPSSHPANPQNAAPRPPSSAPGPAPGGVSSPADVEIVRRQRFLERNRAAAARCRQRRKQYTETLQGEVGSLKQLASRQSNQIATLRKQIAHLKLLLLAHKDCPVTEEQSRQGLFSALLPTDDATPTASTPDSIHSHNDGARATKKNGPASADLNDGDDGNDMQDDDDDDDSDGDADSGSVLSVHDSTAISANE